MRGAGACTLACTHVCACGVWRMTCVRAACCARRLCLCRAALGRGRRHVGGPGTARARNGDVLRARARSNWWAQAGALAKDIDGLYKLEACYNNKPMYRCARAVPSPRRNDRKPNLERAQVLCLRGRRPLRDRARGWGALLHARTYQ